MTSINTLRKATLALAGVLVIAQSAQSQSLIVSNGTIIAATGDQAPGLPVGCLLDGAGTFDTGVMDDAGNVFFRSRLTGTGVTALNERAYFSGTDRSNLTLVVRAADPVPTLGAGETLNTASGTGLGATPRIASTGQMFWLSSFSGGASTTANDTAIFTGTPGNFVIAAREGNPAPGTTGATLPNLSALTLQGTQLSPSGRIAFSCSTVGGDTTSSNNFAWFGGAPGALELIMRKGFTIPSGHGVQTTGLQLTYNSSDIAFHEAVLATTPGPWALATTANDRVLFVYTPGATPNTGTNTVLLREGDLAAGTVGATIGLVNVSTSPFSYGGSSWNNNGRLIVWCKLAPGSGDTVVGVNDGILYLTNLVGPAGVILRKGDLIPGMGGGEMLEDLYGGALVVNNHDRVAFQASLTGGSTTSSDNSAIFQGSASSLNVVVRENTPAPGTTGAFIGNVLGFDNFSMNDKDQVIFQALLLGGDVTGSANNKIMYSWELASGLTPIIRAGDVIEVTPGVFKTVSSWVGVDHTNGDSRSLTFNHAGKLTLRVSFTDATAAIMSVIAPSNLGTPFCSGDGAGTACPCGNNGLTNNGCANSVFAGGAHLSTFGVPSVTPVNDTMVLTASNIPGPGLFFQGSGQYVGGLGFAFGDGLLCAGGVILRLGVVFPVASAATYPGGLTPAPIHVGGGTAAGDVRHYQCWYRDAAAFCSPSTNNLTQGLTVTWIP